MDRTKGASGPAKMLRKRNWTIGKVGSDVLIQCENADDALEIFDWLTEFASLTEKDVVVPLPDVFLVLDNYSVSRWKFTRQIDKSWLCEVARPGDKFRFHDSVGEETARDRFDEADSVWVPAKA